MGPSLILQLKMKVRNQITRRHILESSHLRRECHLNLLFRSFVCSSCFIGISKQVCSFPFCCNLVKHLSVPPLNLRYDIQICVLLRSVMQIFSVSGYVGWVKQTEGTCSISPRLNALEEKFCNKKRSRAGSQCYCPYLLVRLA